MTLTTSLQAHFMPKFLKGRKTENATACRWARKNPAPLQVKERHAGDIMNWKSFSHKLGILQIRTSENGQTIDWTKFMAIEVRKEEPNVIRFKYSHVDAEYDRIEIGNSRRSSDAEVPTPQPMYLNGPPKLSQGKYVDLQALCSGPTPVISHPEYQMFYHLLPH